MSTSTNVPKCKKHLGKNKRALDKFFKLNLGYNQEMLAQCLNIDPSSIPAILEWYARLELGQKIYKAIKNQGYCSFTADL